MGPQGNNADRIADLELRLREQERYTATQGRSQAPQAGMVIRNALSAKRPLVGEETPEDVEYEPSARPWVVFVDAEETPRSDTTRVRAQTRDGSTIDTEGQKLTVYFYGGRWWIATECQKKTFQLERCVPAEESESDPGADDPPRLLVYNQFEPSDVGRTVVLAEYPDSCYTIAAEPCVPEEEEEEESEPETDDAAIERINECLTPICVEVLEIFDNCAACLCEYETAVVPLTICGSDPAEIIYANKQAADPNDVPIDLTEHKDEITRLDDGRCASVGQCMELPDGETAEDVVVLEFYDAAEGEDPCANCVITKLVNCNDSEDVIYTYADLTAWTDTDYIPDLDSDPRQCYQKDHSEDPIEWDPMDPPVDFNAGERKAFTSCDECRGEVIYRGTYNCTPEQCDPANADVIDDIVTADPALAGYDGKWGKVEGLAYEWEIDETAVEGDITHETVEVSGPYDTCAEALAAPISGRVPPLRKVTIDGTTPKWHINTLLFDDAGRAVGVCPEVVEAPGRSC